MQRLATYACEWFMVCDNEQNEERVRRVKTALLGIVKDCLILSSVVMAGAAIALFLG